MYCAHCGSTMGDDLHFCKNCGARNERKHLAAANAASGWFAISAGAVGIVGLVGFYPIVRELLHTPLMMPGYIFLIMAAYLIGVIAMFWILVNVGKKSADSRTDAKFSSGRRDHPSYLRPANTAQLPEPSDTPASVTEHTTRTLEEVPARER